MSLDELASRKDETGKEISNLFKNYKKDSADRKTKDYLEDRSTLLGQLWSNFEATDKEVKKEYEGSSHEYFKRGYYAKISEIFLQFNKDLEKRLKAFDLKLQDHSSNIEESKKPVFIENDKLVLTVQQLNKRMRILRQRLTDAENLLETTPDRCSFTIETIKWQWVDIYNLMKTTWDIIGDADAADFNEKEYIALERDVENICIALESVTNLNPVRGNQQTIDNSPQVKLPTITLPTFDGNYISWRSFYDLFVSVVHQRNIGNSEKMWYLKTSLFGEAQRLIQHLTISDDNYLSVWTMLKDRYNNTRLLVSALLNKLLAQPTLHTESAASIKTLNDVTQECMMSLRNLNVNTENWDLLILHILIKKLDNATHNIYEQGLEQPRNLQSLQEFLTFLEKRFQSLEALGNRTRSINSNEFRPNKQTSTKTLAVISSRVCCTLCKGDHQLNACSGHRAINCPSRHCSKCTQKDNTLLHLENGPDNSQTQGRLNSQSSYEKANLLANSEPPTTNNEINAVTSLSANAPQKPSSYILLSTVIINLTDKWGRNIEARAILDSGSQLNFISGKLAKRLGFQEFKHGQRKQDMQKRINFQIHSTINGFSANIEAQILPSIISQQPSQQLNISSWPIPGNIRLAGPQFHRPGPIDVLIGAKLFYSTLILGQIKLRDDLPVLQNTVFGWTVARRTQITNPSSNSAYCGICGEGESITNHLQRFWELEEAEEQQNNYTLAEAKCEIFFTQTTSRDSMGRIMVRLPFKHDPSKLVESSETALRRFYSLERRLSKNTELKEQYVKFMQEYLDLGHMEEICFTMVEEPYFYLPQYCVLKPESTTTNLRVVFDGSAKTTSNLSLNDVLAIGPAI